MQETVLVTGSSGRVGSAVAARLAPSYHVVGFDRRPPPDAHAGAEPIRVNLRSDESVRAGLEELRRRHGARLASVIHLADYHDCTGAPSPRYEEVNVRGTERLLLYVDQYRRNINIAGEKIDQNRVTLTMVQVGHDWKVSSASAI